MEKVSKCACGFCIQCLGDQLIEVALSSAASLKLGINGNLIVIFGQSKTGYSQCFSSNLNIGVLPRVSDFQLTRPHSSLFCVKNIQSALLKNDLSLKGEEIGSLLACFSAFSSSLGVFASIEEFEQPFLGKTICRKTMRLGQPDGELIDCFIVLSLVACDYFQVVLDEQSIKRYNSQLESIIDHCNFY